jgi:histidine ammonia-lyase
LAIELITAAEALEYRRPLRSSEAVERAHAIVRQSVAKSIGDRPPSPDIVRLGEVIASGAFDSLTDVVTL